MGVTKDTTAIRFSMSFVIRFFFGRRLSAGSESHLQLSSQTIWFHFYAIAREEAILDTLSGLERVVLFYTRPHVTERTWPACIRLGQTKASDMLQKLREDCDGVRWYVRTNDGKRMHSTANRLLKYCFSLLFGSVFNITWLLDLIFIRTWCNEKPTLSSQDRYLLLFRVKECSRWCFTNQNEALMMGETKRQSSSATKTRTGVVRGTRKTNWSTYANPFDRLPTIRFLSSDRDWIWFQKLSGRKLGSRTRQTREEGRIWNT